MDLPYLTPAQREQESRISALALRYRSGDHAALADLHSELEPLIRGFLRPYLSAHRRLPLGVEAEDLRQQAYVALAEAAMDWQPERRDSFVPYFLRSFPWRIDRYLRSQTPSRRTTRFQMYSLPHDLLMDRIADVAGPDGRDWDDALVCAELLNRLPLTYSRVVQLHLFRGLPFVEVGAAVGLSRSAVHETFTRAMALLRSSLAPSAPLDPTPASRNNGDGAGGHGDAGTERHGD